MNNAKLLSDQMRGLQGAIASIPNDAPVKSLCQSFLVDAEATLSEIRSAHPQAYEQTEILALHLASLATCLSSHFITEISERAEKAGEDRRIANAVTEVYADVARAQAAAFWEADSTRREMHVAYVSEQVRDIMLREGFSRTNLRGIETLTKSVVRGWISPFAPDYARKSGRRKEG